MMATTMTPPTAAARPSSSGPVRFVDVRAHLMPDEIISARQLEVLRKQVLIGLIVVVLLLIGWFGLSWWQTRSAKGTLDDAQRHGVSLQSQQNQFAPLVQAQAQTNSIQSQLEQLMVGDLPWKTMLTTLRSKAPSGVALTDVTGTLNDATSSPGTAGGSQLLNTSGSAAIGTLTVTGSAPDKRAVAAYADALATVHGLTSPLISNVEATTRPVTFTVSVVITSDALGGRYATTTTPTTTGGN